jgi:hypothetical protein
LRLDARFRAALYAVFSVLFLTGVAWLPADRLRNAGEANPWSALAPSLLMLHGAGAMFALMLLGALVPLHVSPAWRGNKNRALGAAMAVLTGLLLTTAFGLYYIGSETLRGWTSDLHIASGLAFPVLLTAHVLIGRRRCSRGAKPLLSGCIAMQGEPPGADPSVAAAADYERMQ